MNKIINNNTLLSQKEIDTLIQFLTQNNNKVQDTAVLSQDSIDKLVAMLQSKGEFKSNIFDLSDFNHDILTSISPDLSGYTLCSYIDTVTNYINIIAKDSIGQVVKITPAGLSDNATEDDDSEWGYCIEPAVFDKIATMFKVKYSADEYENICRIFATKRYGSETAFIPKLYLPTQESLAKNML